MYQFVLLSMETKSQKAEFTTTTLNWLIGVNNDPRSLSKIDNTFFSTAAMVDVLSTLKNALVGSGAQVLFAGGAKLIPVNDFILSKFQNQMKTQTNKEVKALIDSGLFAESLQTSILSFRENIYSEFDLLCPSLLTQESRKNKQMEFYVFPMQIIFGGDELVDFYNFVQATFSTNQNAVMSIVDALKSTLFMEELAKLIGNKNVALVPLYGEGLLSQLRYFIRDYKQNKKLSGQ